MVLQIKEDGLVLRTSEHVPEVIKQILLERGWNEFDEESIPSSRNSWNLWWKTQRFRKSEHDEIEPWQRLNHFPRTDAITRKDSLVRNLRRMKCVHGAQIFSFHPSAYILPNEYTKFVSDYAKESHKHGKKNLFWICKPVDLSRGRGIFIFNDLKHLTYDCSVIVQRYITNPLLISGYKFDLRIYVCVPSFKPLTIYTYQEGIARFSTDKFDLTQLNNVFSHLTNTSINKYGPAYATDKERVGPGCKWTLSQLRSFLRHLEDFDELLLWMQISNIITLTLATQAPSVPKCRNCFEVFGFDILVDDQMKPWLLEVNFSPALSMDCQADFIAKRSMLNDLVDLLNFKETDSEHGGLTPRSTTVDPPPASSLSRSLYGGPEIFNFRPQSSITEPVSLASLPQGKSLLTSGTPRKTGQASQTALYSPHKIKCNTLPSKTRKKSMTLISSSDESVGNKEATPKDLTRNTSSSSLTSSVSSVDHCNQPENSYENEIGVNALPQSLAVSVTPLQKANNQECNPCNTTSDIRKGIAPLATIKEVNVSMHKKTQNDTPTATLFNRLAGKHVTDKNISTKPARKKKAVHSAPPRTKLAYSNRQSDSDNFHGHKVRSHKMTTGYRSPYSVSSTAPKNSSQPNMWPRTRVGDFVLTFPLNEAMKKASGQMFDMKSIIKEQQKILKKLLLNSSRQMENFRRGSADLSDTNALQLKFQLMFDDKDANPLYFWGPQNPPLLSTILS